LAKPSSTLQTPFWRADWFAGVAVVLAALGLHLVTDLTGMLERRFYDFSTTSTSRQPSDRIAIIAIDAPSIADIGPWPWPHDVHARLIDQLAAAKAKTVVHTTLFHEPQLDSGLVYIRKMKDVLATAGDATPVADDLGKLIAQAELALDTDAALAASLQAASNVLIPSEFVLGSPQGKPDVALPAYALKSAVDDNAGFSILATRLQQPIASIGEAAAGIGHLNQSPDVDGVVRRVPLLVNYHGKAVPSMALLAAMKGLGLQPADIRPQTGESVQLGKLRIRTDASARMLPQFYKGRDGRPAFAVDSLHDVLSGKIAAGKYAEKIVIIGVMAAGVGMLSPVPGNQALSQAEILAHVTSSILSEHFVVQPRWGGWASLAVFLLVAAYVVLALPRLSGGVAVSVTIVLLVALLAAQFGLLWGAGLWLNFVFPATVLLLGHVVLTIKRFLMVETGKVSVGEESAETSRMMALALQGQGQLDMAFDRLRRVPLNDAVMGNLYSLAQDFERKHQLSKAKAVYEHMGTLDPDYKDIKTRLHRVENLSETVMPGGTASHPDGAMARDGGGVEKFMLGRYQIEKELGKGAMGVVYLGKDPKIGRVVAIKTLALTEEFSGDGLTDARERFFREAESAGRLQHQGIVTIFDAGEEHDLAYIAMEFLKGRDLVDYCKGGNLLPVPVVLGIVARIADALAYAHGQNVVHRDIKPANIMYAVETDTVKVTDFGIARITDSSRTRTGMVLGTPSYMSPEQLAGKKVDGRSDLYSLGVMLYQMLTGVLPLRGESMAELMYKIANEKAPDIRVVRPELPEKLAHMVALALDKRPETRYQSGNEFAADLRLVMADLSRQPLPDHAYTAGSLVSSNEKTVAFAATVAGGKG